MKYKPAQEMAFRMHKSISADRQKEICKKAGIAGAAKRWAGHIKKVKQPHRIDPASPGTPSNQSPEGFNTQISE